MKRVPYPSRALAVHHLNAIGASTKRLVDLFDDPYDGFLDSHSMEINPAGRRRAFVRATPRRCRL